MLRPRKAIHIWYQKDQWCPGTRWHYRVQASDMISIFGACRTWAEVVINVTQAYKEYHVD